MPKTQQKKRVRLSDDGMYFGPKPTIIEPVEVWDGPSEYQDEFEALEHDGIGEFGWRIELGREELIRSRLQWSHAVAEEKHYEKILEKARLPGEIPPYIRWTILNEDEWEKYRAPPASQEEIARLLAILERKRQATREAKATMDKLQAETARLCMLRLKFGGEDFSYLHEDQTEDNIEVGEETA